MLFCIAFYKLGTWGTEDINQTRSRCKQQGGLRAKEKEGKGIQSPEMLNYVTIKQLFTFMVVKNAR